MKLKSKYQDEDYDEGEILETEIASTYDNQIKLTVKPNGGGIITIVYPSIAKLCEEWEDAPEEPKKFWYINTEKGHDIASLATLAGEPYEVDKEIGNVFSSEEEAEKAVEKLKAWKRLKDKGFRFAHCDWTKELTVSDIHIYADIDCEWSDLVEEDLQTVFGGEE